MSGSAAKTLLTGHELREFVVTTFATPVGETKASKKGGQEAPVPLILNSEVWDCETPMGIGHPFRWVLERTEEGVRIRKMGTVAEEIIANPVQEIPLADLYRELPIELESDGDLAAAYGRYWVSIHPVMDLNQIAEEAAASAWRPKLVSADLMTDMGGEKIFKLSSIAVLVLCLVGWITLVTWPTPKANPQELIPPQFAKVLLSPALKSASNQQGRASSGRKGAENNVVQAFQSEAVQKTTKTLLNVNAAKSLLTKSTLLDNVTSKAVVKKVFEGQSNLKQVNKLDVKALDAKSTKVDLVGGKGGGKGTGEGNYGKSTGAAINGQGSSLVAVSTEGLGVDEGLTKDEVGKVIREHLSEVRYCYESAMVRNPGLEGKLVVSFVIGMNGMVKSTQTKETSGDAGLDNCILSRLAKWKYPKPRGKADVGVSYPFIFKSLGN